MAVLNEFKTNAARNNLYRARLDYLRVQNTIAGEIQEANARAEKAEAEKERLRAKLIAAGIDPDAE